LYSASPTDRPTAHDSEGELEPDGSESVDDNDCYDFPSVLLLPFSRPHTLFVFIFLLLPSSYPISVHRSMT